MRIISKDYYSFAREKLMSSEAKIRKTGIQDMLYCFENNQFFPRIAKEENEDFKSYLLELIDDSDPDVRKWLYHLLCLQPFGKDNIIFEKCLNNAKKESECNNIENLSWITSVCAVTSQDQKTFEDAIKSSIIYEQLSYEEFKLSSSAFSLEPYYNLNNKFLLSTLDNGSRLSSMWLTKIFSNQFIPKFKDNKYNEIHNNLPVNAFASLLQHSSLDVKKYAMWAFAQEKGNISSLNDFIPLYKVDSLDSGVRKWYYVKMFQDESFLNKNSDYIQYVAENIIHFENNVCEGILMGCNKLGYSDTIVDLILKWESLNNNKTEVTLLGIYKYILNNYDKNEDFYELTKYAVERVNDFQMPNLKKFINKFLSTQKGRVFMREQEVNYYGNNIQVNYGGHNTQNNYYPTEKDIDNLIHNINEIKVLIEEKDCVLDENFINMIKHMDYEFSKITNQNNEHIQSIYCKYNELKTVKKEKRIEKLKEFISFISDAMTIVSSVPTIYLLIANIIHYIGSLF